jgi:CRISPR-associated protein Csm5
MAQIEEVIKNSKKVIGEKIPCSIEVLSPVHIGSGVKLAKDIDFTYTNDTVTIVPQSELMNYLEQNPDEMQKFIDGGYKLEKLTIGSLGKKYHINGERIFDISEFERNGFGKPYIPGSSIKGSLRTIILKKVFDGLEENEKQNLLGLVNNPKKEWASEPIIKKIFGDDSNHNLMRTLEIFDAEFEVVTLEKVLILSLSNNEATSYKWKKMGRDASNQDNPKYATPIFVEALPIGSKGYSSISLSNFLFNNPTAQSELKFSENSLSNINSLISTINNYSIEKLNSEKKFFENLNSSKKLIELINHIELLIAQHSKLKADEFIMRLSWGSGWKGMTGDFINDLDKDEKAKWIEFFRKKYQMGKKDFPIFPKTRRIVFEDEKPKYLTGWIKIKLNDTKPKDFKKSDNHKNVKSEIDPMELLKQNFKVTESKRKNK